MLLEKKSTITSRADILTCLRSCSRTTFNHSSTKGPPGLSLTLGTCNSSLQPSVMCSKAERPLSPELPEGATG